MATAAGDSTPYGGGAGGKFRKNSSRRPQTTPYDRPPTALRNTQIYNNNNSNGGWLSRIVDPASKLISASAHKFYASVFRKRLLPPPQAPPDVEVQPPENHLRQEDPSRIQEGKMNVEKTQIHGSVTNGVAELEHMLKQKTFTRSEIDRLTALLHSRTVDTTGVLGKRGFEVTEPSELPAVNSSREEFDGPSHDNGFRLSERSDLTPAFRSKVNEDDVASPADLAKAYMGSRCTKVSLSRLGPRNHVDREEPPALSSFQLHRPTVSTVVQKPLSTPGTYQSDSVISRSRGRSAIYNMARTPYSRVMPTATKASGTSNGAFDGQSLSSRKPLKRRCSILENDIGSVGPIRRIRQKSNLLYPKTLGLPPSHSLLTHTTHSEVGEASLYSSPKSHSQEDRGDKSLPVSSSHVSSKSIEMGQRILQQLEKLTPPREKSSEKKSRASGGISAMEVTPGMLHGKANKNLETGGSLMCLQSDHVNCKKEDPRVVALCEVRDSTPSRQGNAHNSSSQVLMNQSFKAYPENKEAKISNGDMRVGSNCTDPVVLKSAEDVSKRSQTFQNGEHELEASHMHSNSNMFLENPSFPEAAKADNPAFPEVQPSSNSLLKKNIFVDSSASAEKGITQNTAMDNALKQKNGFSALPFKPGKSSQTHLSDKADDVKSQRPSSVLPFAAGATDSALRSPGSNNKGTESVNVFKQSDNTPPSFPGSTDSTISFKMPASTPNGNISSLASSHVTPSPVLFSSQSSSSGSSAQSTFTASSTAPINAGVSAKNAGGDANGSMTATINGNSSSLTSSVAFPSFQPGFKFGVPMTSGTDTVSYSKELAFGSSTSSSISVAAAAAPSSFQFGPSMAASTNGELRASDNVSSPVISDQQVFSSATVASTTQSMPSQPAASALPVSSGPSSLALNSNVNQLGSLTSVSAPFSFSSTAGSTGSASSTSIFGANTNLQPSNSPVFGSTINNSSSGFIFGASSASAPSSSASSGFALGTSSVSVPANGTLAGVTAAGSTTSVFAFGSSSSSAPSSTTSSPFSFGASSSVPSSAASSAFSIGGSSFSAPSSTTSSASAFGSSATSATATPSSVFVFGSAAPSPAPTTLQPSQSIFGNGNPAFAFGSSASATPIGNNDQMSMDTMVEDTRSLAPTAQPTAFGQSPTNNFAFGMAPAPSPSGPNPFQLGTQQNQFTATQNPFQASGSFDGGGGFSLGAGGNDKSNRRIVKVSRRVRKK